MLRRRAATAAALVGLATMFTPLTGTAVATAQGLAAPASRVTHLASGWRSTNWSGYAISGSGFRSITGKWTVPHVKSAFPTKYSSAWIGIDGFNNQQLIQTGTEMDSDGTYQAWWEILPATETPIFAVSPGDHIQATITKGGGTSWTITINDTTSGGSFSAVKHYSGPGTSAEWIVEAPTVNGAQAQMANYGRITLDPGTVNGGNPNLNSSESGVMVNALGKVVSTPSKPDSEADGFTMAYGAKVPPPPPS